VTAAPRIAILDTNVLLLLLVAKTDESLLRTFKRVQSFEPSDISLLDEVLAPFNGFLSTPHVLAEVSNFVDQAPQHRRSELVQELKHYIHAHREHYEAASLLCERGEFEKLGLADTGLSRLSSESTVITTDHHLAGKIQASGGSVVNFNHARSTRLLG